LKWALKANFKLQTSNFKPMNYGLYAAYLGMRARQRTLDVIANNIANASTAGFKADHLFHRSIEAAELDARRGPIAQPEAQATLPPSAPGTNPADGQAADQPADPTSGPQMERAFGVLSGGRADFSAGAIRETGRALDVALSGEGFLVVQTPRGERYTRAGSLQLDAAGQLVTLNGDLVVGEGGPVTLRPGEVSIGEDGTVSVQGQAAGRLKIVRFQDPRAALVKEGDSLFAATGAERPAEAPQTRLLQGALETSNVNVVAEMAAMMQNGREFDSLQRSVTLMMNDLGRKVATEIGRI
jgi:flagellar basal-body rod protein FlgF